MKLWKKDKSTLKAVEEFTVGRDREMDAYLASFDVFGSMAHARMLESIGLLTKTELDDISRELKKIYTLIEKGEFKLDENVEDIHSQIEMMLTQNLGDAGKKIHSARSRNDQVLVDIRLFLRHEILTMTGKIHDLFKLLQVQSEKYKDLLLPGYTHLQLAMPSSFGLWFGAYAESLADDTLTLKAAFDVVNRNPLGSAAGYGSSFPINRTMTTDLLGFEDLSYNVVYAQMGRGKSERIVSMAMANVADTLARLSMDACLYMNQNFGFISFPDELTTGSSIMPHKKNPDVFELVRGHCNRLKALPNEIMMLTTNLPSGYHRDLQLMKEHLFPAFRTLNDCMDMIMLMISSIEVRQGILDDEKYKYLFTVEEVNRLVMEGIPFREAYRIVGRKVEEKIFEAPSKPAAYTHEGSIGNPGTEMIRKRMAAIISSFPFQKIEESISNLMR